MFGYVRPMKQEMKICEFQAYNAVYCGFCRCLGKFGSPMRLTLSYDFTFFSLLALSLKEDFCGFENHRCPVKLFSKRSCVCRNNVMDYAAKLTVMMTYAKLKDNLSDGDKSLFLTRLFLLYLYPRFKKVSRELPKESTEIETFLSETARAEKKGLGIDSLCDPTGRLLSSFFSNLSQDENQKQALSRLGYVMGRFIYLLDAADDLERDLKKKCFNPLITSQNMSGDEIKKAKDNASLSLNVCISEAQDSVLKLKLYHFEPIIRNIVFLGIKNVQNAVMNYSNKKERRLALDGKSV